MMDTFFRMVAEQIQEIHRLIEMELAECSEERRTFLFNRQEELIEWADKFRVFSLEDRTLAATEEERRRE